jgi:hypothetical protein
MATKIVNLRMTPTEYVITRNLIDLGVAQTHADALRRGLMLLIEQNGVSKESLAAIEQERIKHKPRVAKGNGPRRKKAIIQSRQSRAR